MHSPIRSRVVLRASAIAAASFATLALAACAPGEPGDSGDSDTIKIAFIQRFGDQQYFIDEGQGAIEAAEARGAEVTLIDVQDDSNEAISQMNTVIGQGFDGIAIVVPDQKIGPEVIRLATEADIPLVAADNGITDDAGNAAPFVGFDAVSMGTSVGERAAELYTESGWSADDTMILSIYKPEVQTCADRVTAASDVFNEKTGEDIALTELHTEMSVVTSQDAAAAALTANPDVKHWLVWGCNDESVTGAVAGLQNGGVSTDEIIGVGLGAYLACKDWSAGVESGTKAALFISGVDVGAAAVNALLDTIIDGKDLPAVTVADTTMVDADTWQDAGVVCS